MAHFLRPNAALAELMVLERVLTHSFVVGELACGTLQTLYLLEPI